MAPMRDPIKNIVFNATAEELKDVMIDGRWVMRERQVLNVDERAVTQGLQEAGERIWAAVNPTVASSVDDLAPQSYPYFYEIEEPVHEISGG